MGFCGKRYLLLSLCVTQILTVIERQSFDFLGFQWIPIFINFFEIIFIILGFFGAYQYRPKYVYAYLIWHQLWLAWNIFLICLYLDVAGLDHQKNKVLKLDPKSASWWQSEGPGCRKNRTSKVDIWPEDNNLAEDCLLNYIHVEVFQASLQVALTVVGVILGYCLNSFFLEEDTNSSRKSTKRTTSLYSIEFSTQLESSDNELDQVTHSVSPKPMTPRRVKRRSVMTRGTTARRSTVSRKHHSGGAKSSTRCSRRSIQNPVTALLEQPRQPPRPPTIESVASVHWSANGHANPTYQQSSTQSLNEDLDELYNNRPASVRSSYSNFHGARDMMHHYRAAPQVPPHKRLRPVTFTLNAGPPGYSQQQSATIAPDSETAI